MFVCARLTNICPKHRQTLRLCVEVWSEIKDFILQRATLSVWGADLRFHKNKLFSSVARCHLVTPNKKLFYEQIARYSCLLQLRRKFLRSNVPIHRDVINKKHLTLSLSLMLFMEHADWIARSLFQSFRPVLIFIMTVKLAICNYIDWIVCPSK